jgi:hypothetical protein
MAECNCPPLRDVFRYGVTTKEPCPVHETPEQLAALSGMLQPAIPLGQPINRQPLGPSA